MTKSDDIFRIHPAIGFARVGNSEEYYIGPETMAGIPEGNSKTTGGLPIKPDTESETITSKDLRDKNGAFKRQAARFKIFHYPKKDAEESYPTGEGSHITIGSKVNGKKVKDIIWTVHLANKKANCYVLENPELAPHELTIAGYENGNLPPLRNLSEGSDPNNAARIKKLTIDPGPRAIKGSDYNKKKDYNVKFDKGTRASYFDPKNKKITQLDNYPKSYPDDSFSNLYCPTGNIDTLGELQTDGKGRLLVLGGYGRSCAWYKDGKPYTLEQDVDNDGWFDDTADGPVSAVLVFEDNTFKEVTGAWVVSTDPGYAPQIMNVVSLWDEFFDTWVRKIHLCPEIYDGRFKKTYRPYFDHQLLTIFTSTALQQWNTNLPKFAQNAHEVVGKITADDNPADTILTGLAFIRDPNNSAEASVGPPLMPLSLGDSGQAFLSPTFTQYFFLSQWNKNLFKKEPGPKLGPGEYLDKAVLANCLGGRFSPGIDMTFIVRQPDIYILDWETSGTGPFRIKPKKLDYSSMQSTQPFLSEGYVPLHSNTEGLEPGDTSKFMAIPWHTDYNSCATHTTDPSTPYSNTLYWSWPAQRPVAVYVAKDAHVVVKKAGEPDVERNQLGNQHYSVRGKGTESDNPTNAGRYQNRLDMLKNWHRIGVVIQGTAIEDGLTYSTDLYLEVESLLDEPEVEPWPINAADNTTS